MSNQNENYIYDFDFTEKDSETVSKSLGRSEEFIDGLNTKITNLLTSYQREVDKLNPTKDFMMELLSVEKEKRTGTFKDNVVEYLKAGRDNTELEDSFNFTDIVKTFTEKFSPEELAIICANQYKNIILEMSTRIVVKDILLLATEINLENEEEESFEKLKRILMTIGTDNASRLFSSPGFVPLVIETIIGKHK